MEPKKKDNFCRVPSEAPLCEKIMKLGQQFVKLRLKIFCIFSYGSHFCSAEQDCFGNLVEGGMSNIHLKYSFEIMLNLEMWFRGRCLLNIFYFSSCSHLVLQSRTVWAIMV